MIKFVVLVTIILLLVLAQLAIFPNAEIFGGRPDLVLVAIVIWSLLRADYQESWLMALGGGLLLDINSGLPFGVITLSLCGTIFLLSRLTTDAFRGVSRLAVVIAVLLATVMFDLLLIGTTFVFQNIRLTGYVIGFEGLWYETLPALFYNIVAAFVLYFILRLVSDWLESREKRIKLLQL